MEFDKEGLKAAFRTAGILAGVATTVATTVLATGSDAFVDQNAISLIPVFLVAVTALPIMSYCNKASANEYQQRPQPKILYKL